MAAERGRCYDAILNPSDSGGSRTVDPAPPATPRTPPAAQLAAAFLLGIAAALLGLRWYGATSAAARPLALERPAALDLNDADSAELRQLPGVGPALAERIVDRRRESGGFGRIEDLREVHGIGPRTLERLRPWLGVGGDKSAGTGPTPGGTAVSKKSEAITEPLDLNRASVEELQRLPGIGPKLAQRIVEARAKTPFKSVDELRRVSGIGPKTLEKLRPLVTVKQEGAADSRR